MCQSDGSSIATATMTRLVLEATTHLPRAFVHDSNVEVAAEGAALTFLPGAGIHGKDANERGAHLTTRGINSHRFVLAHAPRTCRVCLSNDVFVSKSKTLFWRSSPQSLLYRRCGRFLRVSMREVNIGGTSGMAYAESECD